MNRPSAREVAAVSTDPRRFRKYHPMAMEVRAYASSHGGQLPDWVWELSDCRWERLAVTLRELDLLDWARRVAA